MTTSRIRATQTPEQDDRPLIKAWGDDCNGIRLVHIAEGVAGIVLIRAGVHHDTGTMEYDDETVHRPVWTGYGLEEGQYWRDAWDSKFYGSMAAWRKAKAAS